MLLNRGQRNCIYNAVELLLSLLAFEINSRGEKISKISKDNSSHPPSPRKKISGRVFLTTVDASGGEGRKREREGGGENFSDN